MRTVLITGGAGFIGCGVADRLLSGGDRVVVVDSLHPIVHAERRRPERLAGEVVFVPFDVRSREAWDALLCVERPDVVVHLAAETGTGQSLHAASLHADVNVLGTTRMLDALSSAGHVPARIVLASSRAVYGEGGWEGGGTVYHPRVRAHADLAAARWNPVGPDGTAGRPLPSRFGVTPERPTNVYAATKLAQEHVIQAWAAAMGADLSLLRLQNVYGPGQSVTNAYTGVLTLFARHALAGESIDVFEDGDIGRDFVHVHDVVDSLVAASRLGAGESVSADIGSGSSTPLIAVATAIASLAGAPPPFISGRFRDGDVRAASCDISAAARALAYAPSRSLEEGLVELLEWVASSTRETRG
jgi:dTDP-L-rhamnose 4-epimerase